MDWCSDDYYKWVDETMAEFMGEERPQDGEFIRYMREHYFMPEWERRTEDRLKASERLSLTKHPDYDTQFLKANGLRW